MTLHGDFKSFPFEKLTPFVSFFKPKFLDWLYVNEHVYKEFEKRTLSVIARGRTHYSARTIIEVMVHESVINANSDNFKIGNDKAPDLARVFVILHPQYILFWEYRRADWPKFIKAIKGD